MKCPKCGGRTVLDDVHTYIGREQERRCLICGRRYPVDPTAASDPSDKSDPSDD